MMETLFGKHNEIQSHQLENQLSTLNPNDFSYIEYFLSKFITLKLLLIEVKIIKIDDKLIYVIFVKIGNSYFVFVSTFHSLREALISQGVTYKIPFLNICVILS